MTKATKAMKYTTTVRYAVCSCCMLKLVNDDTSGHDYYCTGEPRPLCAFDDFPGELIPGDEDYGFSWQECDGCGSLAGDRYEMIGLLHDDAHRETQAERKVTHDTTGSWVVRWIGA